MVTRPSLLQSTVQVRGPGVSGDVKVGGGGGGNVDVDVGGGGNVAVEVGGGGNVDVDVAGGGNVDVGVGGRVDVDVGGRVDVYVGCGVDVGAGVGGMITSRVSLARKASDNPTLYKGPVPRSIRNMLKPVTKELPSKSMATSYALSLMRSPYARHRSGSPFDDHSAENASNCPADATELLANSTVP